MLKINPVTADIMESKVDTEKNVKMNKHTNYAEQFLLSQWDEDDLEIFQMLPADKKKEVFNQLGNILASNGKNGKDYRGKMTEQDVVKAVQKMIPKVSRYIRTLKSLMDEAEKDLNAS